MLSKVSVCVAACLSLVWEREEYPPPLFPRALALLLMLAWHWNGAAGPHWALSHLTMIPPARHWVHLLADVFLCVWIYIYTHINSCVCVHVDAYLHVYIARCGFTEKCESSWPW